MSFPAYDLVLGTPAGVRDGASGWRPSDSGPQACGLARKLNRNETRHPHRKPQRTRAPAPAREGTQATKPPRGDQRGQRRERERISSACDASHEHHTRADSHRRSAMRHCDAMGHGDEGQGDSAEAAERIGHVYHGERGERERISSACDASHEHHTRADSHRRSAMRHCDAMGHGDEGQGDSAEATERIWHVYHGDRDVGGEERRRTSGGEAAAARQEPTGIGKERHGLRREARRSSRTRPTRPIQLEEAEGAMAGGGVSWPHNEMRGRELEGRRARRGERQGGESARSMDPRARAEHKATQEGGTGPGRTGIDPSL
mmetsp:Transcript_13204/g.42190  ORF Transcript_13204/g.42190 Transcript_13204/m.42190 type:complete len:317 (+) Transcript_13204:42-992(+)